MPRGGMLVRIHGGILLRIHNLAFSEWPQVFAGDEKLATALIDRLADRGTIITTKGKSFRLQRRRNREPKLPAGPAPAEMAEG